MDIRRWLPSKEELQKIPTSMGLEQLISFAVSAIGGWVAAHWVAPDSRLEGLLIFIGTLFALIVAYGAAGYARRQWVFASSSSPKDMTQPQTIPKARAKSAYEIEQDLRVCDELLAFLRDEASYVEGNGNQISNDLWRFAKIDAADHIQEIMAFRAKLRATIERLEEFRAKHPHHPEFVSLLMSNNQYSEFINSVTHFSYTFQRLARVTEAFGESDFLYLIEPRQRELKKHIVEFAKWRSATMKSLVTARKRLSA